MGPSAIAALLNNIPTVWAVPLAAYIGYLTYDLSTFCATDPPALPTFSAQDVLDLLNVFNPVVNIPAASKFQDLIGAYLWHEVCQCDSVATPAAPAPPAAPTGMPALNPPNVSPPYASPSGNVCATYAFNQTIAYPSGGATGANIPLPDGVTQAHIATTWGPPDAFPFDHYPTWQIMFRDASGTVVLETDPLRRYSLGPFDFTYTVPSTATQWNLQYDIGNMSNSVTMHTTMELLCGGGASGSPLPTPCPPDPVVEGLLDQILQIVKLIQRQAVPFAYVSGAAHSGLTGSGHVDVQGLIGCLIELTTTPSNVGAETGDPDTLFDAGWINWGNADGSSEREFISASPQTSFPSAAGQYTRIGYSLKPGVELTITELVREP